MTAHPPSPPAAAMPPPLCGTSSWRLPPHVATIRSTRGRRDSLHRARTPTAWSNRSPRCSTHPGMRAQACSAESWPQATRRSTCELAQLIEYTGGVPSSNCKPDAAAAAGTSAVLFATVAKTLPSAIAKLSSVVVPSGKVCPRVRSAHDQITLLSCRSPSSPCLPRAVVDAQAVIIVGGRLIVRRERADHQRVVDRREQAFAQPQSDARLVRRRGLAVRGEDARHVVDRRPAVDSLVDDGLDLRRQAARRSPRCRRLRCSCCRRPAGCTISALVIVPE